MAAGMLFLGALMLAPPVQADGSGSFNWERKYFNNDNAEVYIERAPRLIYDPNAPDDSYERNGIIWYTNLFSYHADLKYVPSVVQLTILIKELYYCGPFGPCPNEWVVNRFWPISANQYGSTITWSFTISGGGESMTGGLTGTVEGETVHQINTDYTTEYVGDGWYRLGILSIDLAEDPGWNQAELEGGIRLAIRNGDGIVDEDHQFYLKTVWDISWRGCGWICWTGENWHHAEMLHGDSQGTGDGDIYVRTGDSSGS